MERFWTVHYQVPYEKESGDRFPRYRAVQIGFKSSEAASTFFHENVSNQTWYDPSVCWIDGPIEVRE
jgi:hypothetical protein